MSPTDAFLLVVLAQNYPKNSEMQCKRLVFFDINDVLNVTKKISSQGASDRNIWHLYGVHENVLKIQSLRSFVIRVEYAAGKVSDGSRESTASRWESRSKCVRI